MLEIFKEVWPSVSNIWRMKQLQYTWLRSITGSYTDFWSITQNSLDFALETHKLQNDLDISLNHTRLEVLKKILIEI